MTISVIVPTKNRPTALALAVRSVLQQTALPLELIVVDQSADRESEVAVRREVETAGLRGRDLQLRYTRDPSIAGANAARNAGMRAARGEIVAVIEDDMVLDPLAFERLAMAYRRHPGLVGMSGVITNYGPPSRAFKIFDRVFSLGPFFDDRQPLYWSWDAYGEDVVVPITQMGGLMTFRAEAVEGLEFDATPKDLRVRGEDRDFCFQVSRRTGRGRHVFGMAMGARLTHNPSPVGRYRGRLEELRVVSQHYFYSRHHRASVFGTACYLWCNVGLTISALAAACRRRSLKPLRSLLRGWWRVWTGYTPSAPSNVRMQDGAYV